MKSVGLLLDKIAGIGLVVVLALAPTQWSFSPAKGVNIAPADLLLIPVAACWLAAVLLTGRWRQWMPRPGNRLGLWHHRFWPFWPHALFALAALFSVRVAADRADAVKEVVQLTLYFIVAPVLFFDFAASRSAAHTGRRLKILLAALLVPILLNGGAAVVQYLTPAVDTLFVRGVFLNRNVLGGWLALTTPVLFGLMLDGRQWLLRAALGLVLMAVLVVTLAGAAYGVIVGTFLLLAARRGAGVFLAVAAFLMLWQTEVLPHLPRENNLVHFRSTALYDENGTPERRYPEWQAAVSLIITHPLTGVGAGNYQREIGQYYDVVPNATGPAEPDIQNLYLVVAASMGLPALLALLALFGRAVFAAAGTALKRPTWQSGAASGLAAGIAAFALTAVWHPLLVRGIGIPLAAALALAHGISRCDSRLFTDDAGASHAPETP